MAAKEKDEVMTAFKTGKKCILVSTTVIEVGVDIPEATVMIIKNAERFGLSQLHQLRGRIGRSTMKSYCFLETAKKS
jgi:ATP-dependent DNA helicase RecG